MDVSSLYSMILGRHSKNVLEVAPSPLHQVMKFLTNNGVGQILGNQKLSKRCYLLQLRQRGRHLSHIYQASGRLEEIHLVDIEAKFSETRDDFDIQPEFVEETIAVHLGSYEIVQIWSFPCGPFKDQVVLWENQDIFM